MKFLEVILKTVDTCNINCSYCYYFVDTTLDDRQISKVNKKIISLAIIDDLITFLKEGIDTYSLDSISIVMHGGEPLLQSRSDFDKMCSLLTREIGTLVDLKLGIQTNGICINARWCDLFEQYNILPGISIDGPGKYNDLERKDFAGKGTHKRVVAGIRKVQEYMAVGKIGGISTISVIDARHNAKEIFDHLAVELNIDAMSFLLPDFNHDTFAGHTLETGSTVEDYGNFLIELYDAWINHDNETTDIVFFRQIISLLLGSKNVLMVDTGPNYTEEDLPVLTVYHDGTISPDDTYMTTDKNINNNRANLKNSSLIEFVNSQKVKDLKNIRNQTPQVCQSCQWVKICNGGASINRYSHKNGFDNPSVYCSALKMIYSHIAGSLINNGVPENQINQQLNLEFTHETA